MTFSLLGPFHQGYGRPLWLAQGLFKANGGCGYVRKPKFLLESGHGGAVFNPKVPLPVKQDLKVQTVCCKHVRVWSPVQDYQVTEQLMFAFLFLVQEQWPCLGGKSKSYIA